MIIKSVRVQNFRCIKDETLDCENLTALVGPNGAGKSSFLNALDIFYDSNARYDEHDFYDEDTSRDINITVTFTDLDAKEKDLFQKYVEGDELAVEKVLSFPCKKSNQKYYGKGLRNPEFQDFRDASGQGYRKEYKKLREKDRYSDLPEYQNKDKAEEILSEWELSNPSQCDRMRDDGQFFGFKEVGEAHLERHTKFLLIPAVRDASEDASEGRGAVISELMDLVVRSTLRERKEISNFEEEVQEQYKEIFDPLQLEELQDLESRLSETLKKYAPNAGVDLSWQEETGVDIPMPKASIRLVEDEYSSPVGKVGHGLQRSFILTMLQHLILAKSPPEEEREREEDSSYKIPSLIIGIEEPELYQHPNRQRHLSKVLSKLADGGIPDIASRAQVIYSTHSPLFVNLKKFEQIRIFQKEKERDLPNHTQIKHTTLDEVAEIIERADDEPPGTYSGETLRPRLRPILTPQLNEGFFADFAVLVEGIDDRAVIIGTARALGHNLERMGVSVIPCRGKTCLDRPFAIFSNLGIEVYLVWDSDKEKDDSNPEVNHRLLRLLGEEIEDWPEAVTNEYACFKEDLGTTFRNEIGEDFFNSEVGSHCEELKIKRKKAFQNPTVIENIIERGKEEGKEAETLENIVSKIVSKAENLS